LTAFILKEFQRIARKLISKLLEFLASVTCHLASRKKSSQSTTMMETVWPSSIVTNAISFLDFQLKMKNMVMAF
jgi:hypothetical protein